MAVAMLSQSFFFEALPEELNDKNDVNAREVLTRRPIGSSVKLREW